MNKVYRLVFNRTLGVMQVASELVNAAHGGVDHRGGNAVGTLRPISFALWLVLGWVGLVQPLSAQQAPADPGRIAADPGAPANQRPTVITSANGTPQVNITTPSAGGVSRNTYQQFDVGQQGVILNNSRGDVQTQLGGWVQGNPWLATGTARVILNEVNSSNPSHLNGYVEVAGARAQVVIANPAGIQVNGAGFLNASRVTLTTGTPIVTNGVLDGYRVEGGSIGVGGAGLDTSRADYTDIITRSLQVNAGIWANQLQASLGSNVVSADHSSVQAQKPASAAPVFALDVGALGGMYANRIWLVGNEHGVGVRNAGKIGAQAGELVVTADGRLENVGAMHAQQDTRIDASGGIANAGTLSAERELRVQTPVDVDNSGGTLNARRIEVNADALRNRGGSIEQLGTQALQLQAADVSNLQGRIGNVASVSPGTGTGTPPGTGTPGTGTPGTGTPGTGTPGTGSPGTGTPPVTPLPPLATGMLNIAGTLSNDGGRIEASGDLQLSARNSLDNSDGTLGASTLQVQGQALRNMRGTLQVQGAASAQVQQLDNSAGRMTFARGFELKAQSAINRGGSLAHGGSAATTWTIGQLDNGEGSISSNATRLGLDIGTLVNTKGNINHAGSEGLLLRAEVLEGVQGSIATAGAADLLLGRADHRGAQLVARQLELTARDLDNRGGRVLSTGQQASTLSVRNHLDNSDGGLLASNADLQIDAASFGNAAGTVQQAGTGNLRITTANLQGQGGTVLSNGTLQLHGDTLNLRNGTTAAQRIDVRAGDLTTAGGTLTSTGSDALRLQVARTLDNSGGTVGANGALDINGGTVINDGGKLIAAGTGTSRIHASQRLQNQRGLLSGNGDLDITADGLLNEGGSIDHAGTGTLKINATSVQGTGGSIASNGQLQLSGQQLDLQKGSTRAHDVKIDAAGLDISGGSLLSLGENAMQLQVQGLLRNDGGSISANGAQQIHAGALSNRGGALNSAGTAASQIRVDGTLDNSGGSIASNAGNLQLQSGALMNAGGTLSHAGTAGLVIDTGRLDGAKGQIATAGALQLNAAEVDHQGASLTATQLDITAAGWNNRGGRIVATGTGSNTLRVQGTLDNGNGGTLASNGNLDIHARTFGNAGGTVQQAGSGSLAITTQELTGAGGTLLSNGSLDLQGDSLDLREGTTTAQRISIDGDSVITAGGQLSALGAQPLQLQARSLLDNTGGTLGSNGAIDVRAGRFVNDHGKLIAAGEAASAIRAAQLENRSGSISANGNLHIEAETLSGQGGSIGTARALDLQGGSLDLRGGTVAAEQLDIVAGSLDNSAGALRATGSGTLAMQISGRLANDAGTIASNGAQNIQAGELSNRGGTLSSAGSASTELHVDGLFDNSNGVLASNGAALKIDAGSMANVKGTLSHAGSQGLLLRTGQLDGQGGTIASAGAITLQAGSVDHRGATLQAERIALDAQSFDNRAGKVMATGAEGSRIDVVGSLDNGGGGLLASNGDLGIQAAVFGNAGGTVQHAGEGVLSINAGTLNGTGGTLVSNGSLLLKGTTTDLRAGVTSAKRIEVDTGTLITAGGTLTATGGDMLRLSARERIDNSGGTVSSNGGLDLRSAVLVNAGGTLQSAGTAASQLSIGQDLNNRGGRILANGGLGITSGSIDNQGGTLHSAARLVAKADGLLDNSNKGVIASGAGMQLAAASLDNRTGSIEQAGDSLLQIDADTLQGHAGRIVSNGELQLKGETIDLSAGTTAAQQVSIEAGQLDNTAGTLNATGNQAMSLQVRGALGNDGGTIAANGAQQISAGSLSNAGGTLSSAGTSDSRITVTGRFNNGGGTLASNAGNLRVDAGQLVNAAGSIVHAGKGVLTVQATQLDGAGGSIATAGGLQLDAVTVDHRGATLTADHFALNADRFDNQNGKLLATGTQASTVQATTSLDNGGNGLIASNGDLTLSSAVFGNAGGTVQQAGTGMLAINTHTLNGQGGKLLSNGALQLTGETTDLRDGTLSATRIAVDTGTLLNAGGSIIASGSDALKVSARDRLDNSGGTLAGNGTLDLRSAQLLNNRGTIQAAGGGISTLAITHALENRGGRILTTGDATLTAGAFDNRGGIVHIDGSSALTVRVDGLLDNSDKGTLSAGGALLAEAQSINNDSGTVAAGQDMQLTSADALRNQGGLVQAGKHLQVSASGLNNNSGRIIANDLQLDTRGQALDNRSGIIASLSGNAELRSGALDNTGGLLQSAAALSINTAGQRLINAGSNGNGIVSSGTLQIRSGDLDNRGGAVSAKAGADVQAINIDNSGGGSLVSAADLLLRAQQLANTGGSVTAGGNADISLQGALLNSGGLVAATGRLDLQAGHVDNRNTLSPGNGPALGLQGKTLQVTTSNLDNQNGQVIADNLVLQVNQRLDNSGGLVSAALGSDVRADTLVNSGGTLVAGRQQTLRTREIIGDGRLMSQGDMTLELGQSHTNRGEMVANGTLSLSIQGNLDNTGKLAGANVNINAGNITNASTGEISSIGLTRLAAGGALVNYGLLDGNVTHITAATVDNIGSGRIYGDRVAIQASSLNNLAANIGGVDRAGTIAARQRLDLGVGTLTNSGKSLIFSDGDAAIGGALNGLGAVGSAQKVDNIGSTIEVSGNLDLSALAVNNIRENVVVEKVTTVHAPVRLEQPGWFKNANNNNRDFRATSNYQPYEIYYLNPADILEDTPYVTPDGQQIRKAVIRLSSNTSAYAFARGGVHGARASRERLSVQDGTVTIYYVSRADNRNNPDQLGAGAEDPFRDLSTRGPGSPPIEYVTDTLRYNNAYGTCTTTCVQIITYPDYDNPDATLINMQRHPQETSGNEKTRIATRTTVEDVVVSAGNNAVINAGGSMRISTDRLENRFANIAAGRDLAIVGLNRDQSEVINAAEQLTRTSTFDNQSITYGGSSSRWKAAPITEKTGALGSSITAGGKLTIDVGNLRNDNNGGSNPNAGGGKGTAQLDTNGRGAGAVGPGAGSVQGPGQSTGQGAGSVDAQGPGTAGAAQGANGGHQQAVAQTDGVRADAAGAQGPSQAGNAGAGAGTAQDINAAQAGQANANGPAAVRAGEHAGSGGNAAVDGKQATTTTGADPRVVITTSPNAGAPTASLFNVDANRGNHIVETDPRFASYRDWLSSDYLLQRAGFDPSQTQKRLGDGFYEQKLVREQIGELTGRRFLTGHASDEDQYRALLEAGATVASEWGLRPGVALTAEQMARLTSDIVWLVEKDVTLADGSVVRALVPQVYLRVLPGDLGNDGALLAGAEVDVKLRGDLVNSGTIAGRQLVSIDAGNIRNLSGGQISGAQVGLSARQDIDIIGSTVKATDALALKAGGNITVASTTTEWKDQGDRLSQQKTTLDRVAGLYVTNSGGDGVLSVVAGGDIGLKAAEIRNAGSHGITQLVAGGNLDLGAQTLGQSSALNHDSRNHTSNSQTTHAVTSIEGAGDVVLAAGKDINLAATRIKADGGMALQAGGDINSQALVDSRSSDFNAGGKRSSLQISQSDETVRGSQLQAGDNVVLRANRDINLTATQVASSDGTLSVAAGRDVNLLSANETHDFSLDSYDKKKKTLSSTTTTRHAESSDSYAIGTGLMGESVSVTAGRDLTAVGAVVDATGTVVLGAGNNVLITSAEDHHSSESSETRKKSGFTGGFSNGTASIGYGSSKNSSSSAEQSTTQVGSAIASREGSVLINAGNQLTIAASDVAAGKDLTLVGKDINLIARQDTVDTQASQSSKSSGFSVGVTYDPAKAYRTARDNATEGMADSGTMMGRITRTAEGVAAGVSAAVLPAITAGSQRSNSNQSHSTSDARVSNLNAGGNLSLIANGGSITSQGAQMTAEGNAVLLATKDIVFDVAHNTERSDSDSRGKGWGIATNSAGLPFGTNNSRSEGAGQSDTITGTQLSVGGGVRMATTEGDISLTAANIAAEKDVSIRAAGDLTIRSGQDTVSNANRSDSKAIGTVQISDTEKFSGWHREQHRDDSAQVSQVASTIGSLGGNVNLTAGGKYTQSASNVVAAKDVNITAAEIELLTADESGHYSQSDKDLKIGAFARVKSPLIDLLNNVDAARKSDDRLQKMQGLAAGANAYQAASAISSMAGKGGGGALISAEAGVGFKTSSSSADGSSQVSRGSTIQGGGNVNLTSTQGDIHVVQGNLSAGNTLSLDSAGDILLEAGKAHVADRSKSSNAGAEVGVGVAVGAQTGVYVYAEASVGSSKSNAESSTWQNTTLTGKNISMKAEGDTTLRGATATADRIDVKTGGTLTIESLQDVAESMSKNSQVGGRVQVSFGTAWNADGYASGGKANGSYQGVGQQSGLFAGNGGYHVDAGHVNLVGGAIASTNAGNSELTADSLTFTDLQNHMDYKATSGSISGGFGSSGKGPTDKSVGAVEQLQGIGSSIKSGTFGGVDGVGFGGGLPMHESGSDSSSTRATLTEGNITIGGRKTTAAELGVNTDAAAAHRALEAMPDANKMLADQQAMANAAGTVLATSKQIASDIGSYGINKITDAYLEGKSAAEKEAFANLSSKDQYAALAGFDSSYPDALVTQQKWAPDGTYGRALNAVSTALVGGVAGQAGGQVISNTLAPYAAELIGKTFDPNKQSAVPSEAMQMLSHALLGALLAEANGGSAGTGAAAAGGGELAAKFLGDYYARQNGGQLTPEQEQQIKALGQAVGAMAGGIGGDGAMGAALGATIAKNSVENNYLNHAERMQFLDAMLSCMKSGERCGEQKELAALSDARNTALIAACTAAADSPACRAEQSKLGDAYWSLTQNDSTYLRWINDNGLDLAQAALTKGNGGQLASDLLTHTSSLDARYKITCAAAGRCDPFTAGMLALNGKTQEAAANAALNLLFDKAGSGAGVVTNAGGMVMDMAKMNAIYMSIESTKQALNDFQRIGEIGGWGVMKEKGAGAWSSISGYFGNGWDAATYELGLNQKWNLADVAANGFTKGDIGLDVALAVISLGDVTAMRAAAKARKLAALESGAAAKPVAPDLVPPRQPADVPAPVNKPLALPSPEFNVPNGYTLVKNADGTASVTGPRGGTYTSTGRYTDEGKPIFKDNSGGYVTLDGARSSVPAPVDFESAPKHHICTNKCLVGANGKVAWTKEYMRFFEGAGLDINKSVENLVAVKGHRGPHPEAYHQYVYDNLDRATSGLKPGTAAYNSAVTRTLERMKAEAVIVGSQVNKWLTRS
ncbi:TPA: hemagglutinin repeat-containing protein [Stenotrophomonas maltophilia]|nr:hemagglutinin repeat-containing protein [Stenotrophomonas maltophilia]HDS1659686.1 hemagglutinin repeat-containing protein [Stenotrophomonas maltophilia]HDS1673392.1 hemagglutinin repeat-containing protein [Stenotrophomonas maltophilia]